MAPKDENELCRMMKTAIEYDGPIALRYPRGSGIGVEPDSRILSIPVGKAEVLSEGGDVLILAIGRSVNEAMAANDMMAAEGIAATVVNCRFVKPLDADLICRLAGDIPRIITVEENVLQGGFGSAVIECLFERGVIGCRVERIGIDDTFVAHGAQRRLRSVYRIDADAIAVAARKLLQIDSGKKRNG